MVPFLIIFIGLCITALLVVSGIEDFKKIYYTKRAFYKFGASTAVVTAVAMWLILSKYSAIDWIVAGCIFLGIATAYAIFVGIAFIKGCTMREALCAIFKLENKRYSKHKISDTTRKKIGIATIITSAILLIACAVIVLGNAFNNTGNSSANRKCGYCGEEGANSKFGSHYYCRDCYNGLADAKDRVENN